MGYGRAFFTAIGTFVGSIGASVQGIPELALIGKILIVAGAVVVFVGQKLFEAGFIGEKRSR